MVEFVLPPDGLANGATNAPLVLVEFGSYTCPACRVLADSALPSVEERFITSGLLRYAYVDLSPAAAEAISSLVECWSTQRGFLRARRDLYTLISANPDSARTLIASPPACVADPKWRQRRQAERAVANQLNVRGTPTMVVGRPTPEGKVVGWVIIGAIPRDSLLTLIDSARRRVQPVPWIDIRHLFGTR
jgi:protein-disulfide isomerase